MSAPIRGEQYICGSEKDQWLKMTGKLGRQSSEDVLLYDNVTPLNKFKDHLEK